MDPGPLPPRPPSAREAIFPQLPLLPSVSSSSPPAACALPPRPAPGAASHKRRVAQRPRQRRQRRQMLVALSDGPRRITRSTGRRRSPEVDWPRRPHEQRERLAQRIQPCCGRAKPLPSPSIPGPRAPATHRRSRADRARARCRPSGQFLQPLRLVVDAQPDHDPVRTDDLAERHHSGIAGDSRRRSRSRSFPACRCRARSSGAARDVDAKVLTSVSPPRPRAGSFVVSTLPRAPPADAADHTRAARIDLMPRTVTMRRTRSYGEVAAAGAAFSFFCTGDAARCGCGRTLVDTEPLGHVFVGAEVERRDLRRLVLRLDNTMIGMAPAADAPDDLRAVDVRQSQIQRHEIDPPLPAPAHRTPPARTLTSTTM